MMEYKGYVGCVTFDDDADTFHGEIVGTRDVITFQGKSVEEIRQAFYDSIDEYLEWCKEIHHWLNQIPLWLWLRRPWRLRFVCTRRGRRLR